MLLGSVVEARSSLLSLQHGYDFLAAASDCGKGWLRPASHALHLQEQKLPKNTLGRHQTSTDKAEYCSSHLTTYCIHHPHRNELASTTCPTPRPNVRIFQNPLRTGPPLQESPFVSDPFLLCPCFVEEGWNTTVEMIRGGKAGFVSRADVRFSRGWERSFVVWSKGLS